MRVLYGRYYRERIKKVAAWIPENTQVVDLCAGDCSLYRYGLTFKPVDYRAFDINSGFIRWAAKRNIPMQRLDLHSDPIPDADSIVMMSSLYQFIPYEKKIVRSLIHAAKRRVILTEPIRNIAQSRFPLVGWIGKKLTQVGDHPCTQRFDEETLRALLTEFGFQTIQSIAGGREILAVYTLPTSSP